MRQIRGAGGGGGKGGGDESRAPIESPDSLRSRQYARVLDVVSEGEVVGLLDGLKSVYLDDTPVQNSDGSYNFTGVSLVSRNGTQSQTYVPGFQSVEAETAVSVPVLAAVPVVRSISNANANAVRVTVSVPQLSFQDITNGDMSGTSVAIAIDLQTDGGGYVQIVSDTISGKTTSRYQRAYRIELSGSGPWDVRVRRLTADSGQVNLQNTTVWDSYTEIIDARLTYPNSALVALSVDAERFRNIPRRGYEMKGIKVRIPANYDPETRAYTGVWDGTFTTAWTDNPAWCFYDLLTSERYGLGSYIDADQVDKWALYQIAQYCDELVDDGFGGTEPRFACSMYLQSPEEAYNVISAFSSVFCSLAYWAGGSIVTSQDAPADPVALFAHANVVPSGDDGGALYFNYSGSSIKARHTVALVSWNDPSDRYRQKIEYVEDQAGVARYGVVQTQVVAVGCTSRGQAHRFGRRILFAERLETEVITFRTGLDGIAVSPGNVIQTTDPTRAGSRLGGRLLSATVDAVVLDAAVILAPDTSYTLWAVLPDGTVESRAVTTAEGEVSALDVSPAFTEAPQALAIWVLASENLVPETWRVISVSEVDETQAEVSALAYRADKYLAIEQDMLLEPLRTSSLNAAQPTPTDLVVTESLYLITPDLVGTRITVSWLGNAPRYELQYRRAGQNWTVITTESSSVDIQPVDAGIYEFSLVAANAVRRSMPRNLSVEVLGKSARPGNVAGFTVIKSAGFALGAWDFTEDLDVRVAGRVVIRHCPVVTGGAWEQGVIFKEFNGDAEDGLLPLVTGTYMAKFRDSSGNYSAAEAIFVATEGMVTGFTTVGTIAFHPDFDGTNTDVGVVDGRLELISGELWDSDEDIDSDLDIDGGEISATGMCDFTDALDLGSSAIRRVQAGISAISFDVQDFIDGDDNIDSPEDIDGDVINDCDATVFLATTDDDPSGSPVWSEWHPFFVGDFEFRALKFRLQLDSGSPSHTIAISALSVSAKVPA